MKGAESIFCMLTISPTKNKGHKGNVEIDVLNF